MLPSSEICNVSCALCHVPVRPVWPVTAAVAGAADPRWRVTGCWKSPPESVKASAARLALYITVWPFMEIMRIPCSYFQFRAAPLNVPLPSAFKSNDISPWGVWIFQLAAMADFDEAVLEFLDTSADPALDLPESSTPCSI